MAGVVGPGAMAGRFAAAPDYGGKRTRPEIPPTDGLLQELGSISFKGGQRSGHGGSLLSGYIRSELCHKKEKPARCTSVSHTPARPSNSFVNGRKLCREGHHHSCKVRLNGHLRYSEHIRSKGNSSLGRPGRDVLRVSGKMLLHKLLDRADRLRIFLGDLAQHAQDVAGIILIAPAQTA